MRFSDESGARLYYVGLHAFDASARELAAFMDVVGDVVEIHVDVTGAAWPVTIDPVSFTATTANGTSIGDAFGDSVAVGNINNDAFADFAVAANSYSNAHAGEGAVYWFLGNSGGFGSAQGPVEPNVVSASSGSALALGDVDADGLDDLIVGAPGESAENVTSGGRIRVYLNTGSGYSSPLTPLDPNIDNCGGGADGSIVSADFNDDGVDDVAVWCVSNGRLLVWNGVEDAGPSGTPAEIDTLSANGAGLAIGLVNDDLIPDLAYPADDVVVILFGDPDGLSQSNSVDIDVTTTSISPRAALVDLEGDTFADLVVTDPTYESSQGRLLVFNNPDGDIATTAIEDVTGDNNGDLFGSAVVGGDANGDGCEDVLVCAPGFSTATT